MEPIRDNTLVAEPYHEDLQIVRRVYVYCHGPNDWNEWSLYLYGNEDQNTVRISMTPGPNLWGILQITRERFEPWMVLQTFPMHLFENTVRVGQVIWALSTARVLNYRQLTKDGQLNFWM